jgi:O-antigen/teichoic acid export membrane protein
MSLVITIVGWPILGASVVAVALIAKISIQAGLWAAAALVFWQVQETLRRSLTAHLRFGETLIGDSISNLGQVIAVVLLAWMGKLTLATTFQAMALTSAVAALIQVAQVGMHTVALREIRSFLRECWDLGRWVLMGNLSGFIIGPLFNWNFAYWAGKELLGVQYALTNLLRLANPLAFAIATLIVPHASRVRREEGMHRAKRVLYRFGLLGALLLTPYLGMLLIFPKTSILLIYPHWQATYLRYAPVLQIAAIAAAVTYLATVTGALLNGVERSRWAFVSQLLYAGATRKT